MFSFATTTGSIIEGNSGTSTVNVTLIGTLPPPLSPYP